MTAYLKVSISMPVDSVLYIESQSNMQECRIELLQGNVTNIRVIPDGSEVRLHVKAKQLKD